MFGGIFPTLPREALQSAIRSGGMEVVETDLHCDDGTRLPVEVRLESIPQRPGVGATVLAVARDLSARRRAEAEKRDFLSLVSHELRTPLASIYGALDLLVNHSLEIDGAADLLSSAYGSCGSLLRLADDMLDVAKIDANRMAFRFQSVDIAVMVPEAVEALRPFAASRGVELVTSSVQEPAVARVDADRFVQILNNLLANAIRHAPSASAVEVLLRTDLSGVSVSVVDHGAGVPEAFVPRLFERFARGEDSAGGSGLGLSISESLCEGMGGRIWHDRTAGGGATFSIWFPFVEDAGPLATGPAAVRTG
jgi:signal transduction histidine kinase